MDSMAGVYLTYLLEMEPALSFSFSLHVSYRVKASSAEHTHTSHKPPTRLRKKRKRSLIIINMYLLFIASIFSGHHLDSPSKDGVRHKFQSLSTGAQEIHSTPIWIKLTLTNTASYSVPQCASCDLWLCY